MEVGEAEVLRVVDYHCVGVGYVEAVFDECGGYEYVDFAAEELHHGLFDLFAVHLSVGDADVGVGDESGYEGGHFGEVFDAVGDEECLSAARHFVAYGVAYGFFVEGAEFGLYGLPVGGRGADDAEVAGAHEAELEGAGYGCGGEGEAVDVDFHLAEFFFGGDAEFLFFVDDEESEVFEF